MPQKWATIFSIAVGLGLIVLVAGLAFAVSPVLIYPAQSAKTFTFLFGMATIIGLFACSLLLGSPRLHIHLKTIDIVGAILFGYIILNRYLLTDLGGFSVRFYELLGLAVLYFLVRFINSRWHPWLISALAVAGGLQAGYGILQLYGYYPSLNANFTMTGSFFNPGPYGGFLATTGVVAGGLYLFQAKLPIRGSTSKMRWCNSPAWGRKILGALGGGAALIIAVILPATRSRAAVLAALTGGGYLVLRRYGLHRIIIKKLGTSTKKAVAIGLVTIVVGSGLAGTYFAKKDSADGRLLIWQISSRIICRHPFAGVGFDRFTAVYMPSQARWLRDHPDSPLKQLAGNTKHAFNFILQVTTEEGLIGLIILITLGAILCWAKTDPVDPLLRISEAGLVAIATFGLFSYPSDILPIKVAFIVFLATAAVKKSTIITCTWIYPGLRQICALLAICGALIATCCLKRWLNATRTWTKAFSQYQTGKRIQSLRTYRRAQPILGRKGDFLMNYGKALSMVHRDSTAIVILKKAANYRDNLIVRISLGNSYKRQKQYVRAERSYRQGSAMIPYRFYPRFLLVKLYISTNQWAKAKSRAKILLQEKPKVSSLAIRQMKKELRKLLDTYYLPAENR